MIQRRIRPGAGSSSCSRTPSSTSSSRTRPSACGGILADPLPMELDTSEKRDAYRVAHLHLFDRYLAEKVAIVTLVCVNFAEMLPGTTARPPQVVVAVGVLVVINSFLGLAF